jgi:hypothetical protein
MQYNSGLHQFLQMKENVPVTTPNLTTNYISNVGYFKKYKNNILGLTG